MHFLLAACLSLPLLQDKEDASAAELRGVWENLLKTAIDGKIEPIAKALRGWKFSREEFTALFGDEKTKTAYENYEKFWKAVEDRAAEDLAKRITDKKYDTVDVWCLNTADDRSLFAYEKTTLASLADKNIKLYVVRLRVKSEKEGYLLTCFSKIGDHWRAGLKVGKCLNPND